MHIFKRLFIMFEAVTCNRLHTNESISAVVPDVYIIFNVWRGILHINAQSARNFKSCGIDRIFIFAVVFDFFNVEFFAFIKLRKCFVELFGGLCFKMFGSGDNRFIFESELCCPFFIKFVVFNIGFYAGRAVNF